MTVIILAAGSDIKWGNYLGVPKHLIPIKGEPLIHRTQRQLRERGETDICVVTLPSKRQSYCQPFARYEEPVESPRYWTQEWDGSRHLWNGNGKTTILYGDCYFTDALMDAITSDSGEPWHAYARWGASDVTGKGYGEMFGWTFLPEAHALLDRARETAIHAYESGQCGRVLGWEVYRLAVGINVTSHEKDNIHAVDWSDETEDFDDPHEWHRWLERNGHLISWTERQRNTWRQRWNQYAPGLFPVHQVPCRVHQRLRRKKAERQQ